jgi:hypothetical protein
MLSLRMSKGWTSNDLGSDRTRFLAVYAFFCRALCSSDLARLRFGHLQLTRKACCSAIPSLECCLIYDGHAGTLENT